ncbi:MAG: hypothetical protein IRZ06_12685 [Nevskia sp.]|nr:hypothetical protein [Nevskia sp.]
MSRAESLGSYIDSLHGELYEKVVERIPQYGDPQPHFARLAKMWSAVLNHDVTPRQVLLCLISLKLLREATTDMWDNIVDIAGYAVILAEGEDGNWASGDD